ncbi:hypothetical protein KST27_01125 [Fusobacterium nucleatum]|jgi:hypothetical protein|uniref:hypothetical protein n=1 Tax=Fusobacterium nucleatum TaxID=851 RepID=UPI0030D253DA
MTKITRKNIKKILENKSIKIEMVNDLSSYSFNFKKHIITDNEREELLEKFKDDNKRFGYGKLTEDKTDILEFSFIDEVYKIIEG